MKQSPCDVPQHGEGDELQCDGSNVRGRDADFGSGNAPGSVGAPHESMVEKREGPENEEIPGKRQAPQHNKDVLHQHCGERHVSRSPCKIEHGRCGGKTYRGEIEVHQ